MHPSLAHVDHSPWPMPDRAWAWRQSWRDLLFAHWPVPATLLRPLVPPELNVQEFDGTSWVGVVPFRMSGVMRRPLPDVPGISAFPEINVRLYVERDGKPGVWFLSLDATNALAVWAARRYFYLPYHRAQIAIVERDGVIHYRSRRRDATFAATYKPTSDPYRARAGTLEHSLTERYCLYAKAPDGSLWRNDVHHEQWPLQCAEAEIEVNTMLGPYGLTLVGSPALLHFARRIDVVVWDGEQLTSGGS